MATPKRTTAGTWRVQIEVRGVRDAATLPTKRQAVEWAARRKAQLLAEGSGRVGEVKTLAQAMQRYTCEVSPTKRGEYFEVQRLAAFVRQPQFPAQMLLAEVGPQHLAAWRDARLAAVQAGTVLRDMVLLAHVFEVARREWRWIAANPMNDVRKPAAPPHRERVIAPWEVRRMLRTLRWSARRPVRNARQAAAWCFVLALQTGMRLGELCGLRWEDVRSDHVLLHAGKTKTGKARAVPLVHTAQRTVRAMQGFNEVSVFGLKCNAFEVSFRRMRAKAGLAGFTFHDARHTAATRLALQVDVLTLCKIFGWSSTTRALTYYNPTASEIAARLNAAAPSALSR